MTAAELHEFRKTYEPQLRGLLSALAKATERSAAFYKQLSSAAAERHFPPMLLAFELLVVADRLLSDEPMAKTHREGLVHIVNAALGAVRDPAVTLRLTGGDQA